MNVEKYNDNELLYFISESDEIALDIIVEKYKPLIKSRLIKYRIKEKNFEDFYQECLIILYKCVYKYREDKNVTFNSYLDSTIQQRIRNIILREKDYFYNVMFVGETELDYMIETVYENYAEDKIELLSKFELKVYNLIKEQTSIEAIYQMLGVTKKSIYNTINRIKLKMNTNNNINKCSNNKLSNFEKQVYDKHVIGYKPNEISYLLRVEVETVYNALKRIKRKLK